MIPSIERAQRLVTFMEAIRFALRRGSMFCGPKEGATEEEYYFAEWSEAEKEAGDHRSVMKFVRPCPKPEAICDVVDTEDGDHHMKFVRPCLQP